MFCIFTRKFNKSRPVIFLYIFVLLININCLCCNGNELSRQNFSTGMKICCENQNSFIADGGICNNQSNASPFLESNFFEIDFENPLPPKCPIQEYIKEEIVARVSDRTQHMFHPDGSLELYDEKGTIYFADMFCLDSITSTGAEGESHNKDFNETFVIFVPDRKCSPSRPYFRKCCFWDENIQLSPFNCTYENASYFDLHILKDLYEKDVRDSMSFDETLAHTSYRPNHPDGCTSRRSVFSPEFRITESGTVKIHWDDLTWIEIKEFCLDIYIPSNASAKNSMDENIILVYCASEIADQIRPFVKTQMIYCGISWIFILLTLWIYLILWRKHSIHGWTQFAFLVSTFGYFFMRFVRRWIELASNHHLNSWVPDRVDTFFTFGLLTNLVNLSFHMLWTFWKIQPERILQNWRDLKRLYISLAICWTVALLLTLIELPLGFDAAIAFQKFFTISLLVVNVLLVVATSCIVWFQLKQREGMTSSGFDHKTMVKMFVKLFCITGMIWSFKIFEQTVRKSSYETGWFWGTVQFVTYMYGVVLFLVFGCNSRMLQGLKDKYPRLKKLSWNVMMRNGQEDINATSMVQIMSKSDHSDSGNEARK